MDEDAVDSDDSLGHLQTRTITDTANIDGACKNTEIIIINNH